MSEVDRVAIIIASGYYAIHLVDRKPGHLNRRTLVWSGYQKENMARPMLVFLYFEEHPYGAWHVARAKALEAQLAAALRDLGVSGHDDSPLLGPGGPVPPTLRSPAGCPFTVSFLGEGSPSKIDDGKKGTLILTSLLEDLGKVPARLSLVVDGPVMGIMAPCGTKLRPRNEGG